MNEAWKTFLGGRSATFDDSGSAVWDAAPLLADEGLCDLSHLGLMEVSGDDSESFLQGQLTADVKGIDPQHWGVSSYCTPKGRMLADFRICRLQDAYLLQLPQATHALLMKRLPMFVLMSRVGVRDGAEHLVSFGCWGSETASLLAARLTLPQAEGEAVQLDGGVLLRLPGETPRFLVIGENRCLQPLWEALEAQASPCGYDAWRLLEIRAAYPTIFAATSEAFVPQMCNLQRIGGVSFTKGCFVGQEVVARMKYLGKLKRRMYLARAAGEARPQPGDELFAPRSTSGQGAGVVVDACPSPAGGYEMLVVAEVAAAHDGDVRLWDADGPQLSLSEPAYGFDPD